MTCRWRLLTDEYRKFEGGILAARYNVIFAAMQRFCVLHEMVANRPPVHHCPARAPEV